MLGRVVASGARQPLACPPRAGAAGAARARTRRPLPLTEARNHRTRHELEQRSAEIAPALLELPGCGAVTAAKLLAEIGPIDRFQRDAQLARHGGVAPLEASSGRVQRHRLDRGGNRQLNAALYRDRDHASPLPPGRPRLSRTETGEGKSRREAIRCFKRLLVRVVFTHTENEPRLDIGATLAHPSVFWPI